MTKDDVKKLVYAGLDPELAGPGFKLKKSDGAFVRSIPGGQQKIFVPLADFRPEFVFSLAIGIRIDSVEDIFNRFSGADAKGQKLTTTTITQLSYFTNGTPKEFRVSTEADVQAALASLHDVIQQKILPFLDHHATVQALDAAVNSATEATIDSTVLFSRAMHAIILAKVNANPAFPELVAEFRKQLQGCPPFDRDRFQRLADFLGSSDSPAGGV